MGIVLIIAYILAISSLVLNLSLVTTLTCKGVEPSKINCSLTHLKLLDTETLDSRQIQGLKVEIKPKPIQLQHGRKIYIDGYVTHKVFLQSGGKNIPIEFDLKQARQIDNWLKNPDKNSLEIKHNKYGQALFYLLFSLLFLAGVGIFATYNKLYIFDAEARKLLVEEEHLFKYRSKSNEYSFTDISEVFTDQFSSSSGKSWHWHGLPIKQAGYTIYSARLRIGLDVILTLYTGNNPLKARATVERVNSLLIGS